MYTFNCIHARLGSCFRNIAEEFFVILVPLYRVQGVVPQVVVTLQLCHFAWNSIARHVHPNPFQTSTYISCRGKEGVIISFIQCKVSNNKRFYTRMKRRFTKACNLIQSSKFRSLASSPRLIAMLSPPTICLNYHVMGFRENRT